MPRGAQTLLTEDLKTKIEKLVSIGFAPEEVPLLLNLERFTWYRWFGRRHDERGVDLREQHGTFRRNIRAARRRWLDQRDKLAADILFPQEDVAREIRP